MFIKFFSILSKYKKRSRREKEIIRSCYYIDPDLFQPSITIQIILKCFIFIMKLSMNLVELVAYMNLVENFLENGIMIDQY